MTMNSTRNIRVQAGPVMLTLALTTLISGCTLSTDFDGYVFAPGVDAGGTGRDDAGITVDTIPGCTPTTEVCNGLDDNCNGSTDENLGTTTCGMGVCARTIDNCAVGVAQVCTAGTPVAESCNGLDDNCDGSTDENLGSSTCGIGACARTVDNCAAGVAQVCIAGTPVAESCNGLDDNCDGSTDESLGRTTCGVGACVRTIDNCAAGMPQACTPGPAGVESCNGLDDDCNGDTDEALGTTTCGRGVCAVTVKNCEAGVTQVCRPAPPSREICGDALDNDCDGTADRVPLLLLGDNNPTESASLESRFNAAGFATTVVEGGAGDTYQGTPAASSFRAVVIIPGNSYAVDMPNAGQLSIANAYTVQGTGIVMTEWAAYKFRDANHWKTLFPVLRIFERTGADNGIQTYTRTVPHPVTAGLPDTVQIVSPSAHNVGFVVNGGVEIMSRVGNAGRNPAIVVRDDAGKRIVHFGHSAGWSSTGAWTEEDFLRQSMVNAARWAAKCEP